jgi:ribosomal protein S18 acetylase RimI-like enzyme
MTTPNIQHLDSSGAAKIFEEIVSVYTTVYADSETEEDFENFRARGATQLQGKGFDLVTARQGGELVGFAYGLTLQEGSTWWRGLEPKPAEGFTEETGDRSFAVIELAVLPNYRSQGLGRRLMDELLAGRYEERATLATDPSKTDVQSMYERWGWRKVGRVPGVPGAPLPAFDLYVLPLRGGPTAE